MPTNTELRVAFTGYAGDGQDPCEPEITELRIEPEPRTGESVNVVGAVLEVDGTAYPTKWIVARLAQPLLAGQRYSLISRVSPTGQCACEGDPAFGAWHSVGEFITGEGPDVQAPELDDEKIDLRYGALQRGDNTCGPFHSFSIELIAPLPEAASQQTRYNLYLDGELHMRYVEGGAFLPMHCVADGGGNGRFVAEGHELEVRAIDLAGNESENGKSFELRDLCAEDEPSATVDAGEVEADGGQPTVTPAGPRETGESSGCSASTGVPTFASLFVLALMWLRRATRTAC